jgi:ABC-type lipoprotein export system ATPase subunit
MLEIKSISKIYKANQDISAIKTMVLSLPERGMVFILGKSGSGKSTLLNLIGGIDDCTTGDIIFKNRSLKNFTISELDDYRNYHIGFIFQEFNLISQLSVLNNVSLGLEIQNRESISIKDEVNVNLKRVDMADFINRKAGDLSGGEKQRIAIARALIRNPEIILADEPTGNLDIENSFIILDLLKKLSRDRLVIIVTHDREFAYQYADRIIELSNKILTAPSQLKDLLKYQKDAHIVNK